MSRKNTSPSAGIFPASQPCRSPKLRKAVSLVRVTMLQASPHVRHFKRILDFGEGQDVRRAWPKTLEAAGLEYFWLYDLRHTFASRLTEAGVSPLFVAQIMGHSSPSILQTYAKAIDEYRRTAISKLEALRDAQSIQSAERTEKDDTTLIQ